MAFVVSTSHHSTDDHFITIAVVQREVFRRICPNRFASESKGSRETTENAILYGGNSARCQEDRRQLFRRLQLTQAHVHIVSTSAAVQRVNAMQKLAQMVSHHVSSQIILFPTNDAV